ncbi:hypothetical protein [Acaryochloris sp. CCMEE 5410]|uniref:hypothetical protein n=1 Tax=Acaryochloris sp. CCMEE 5410 TaxID=310037 RepID=UPI0002483EDE|nr:hypothetical protein [Acaryochloris sp. CCMEE 5410]KAI9130088.1 hypothetical protein ON05_031130 [Acaryochloris sp. CCMEE 5410]
MTVQKVSYATAGLLLVAALAVFTPRVQAQEQQQLGNTQTGTEAPASTGSESSAPHQPMGNGMQHNMPHDMPGMKSGDMQHDMGDMQHNMPGMDSGDMNNMQHNMGDMQHDKSGTNSTTSDNPTEQSPAN